jgi:hypothetical protein
LTAVTRTFQVQNNQAQPNSGANNDQTVMDAGQEGKIGVSSFFWAPKK